MVYFDYSSNVIEKVIDEINNAKEYIRIAIFQLHNKKVFDLLEKKLKEKIKIEIFTLPYDSINEDIYDLVTPRFEKIKQLGAIIYECKWNIGDPERTTTAVNRWYSFHGKFIVTDNAAIALSANFIEQNEIDAVLIFKENSIINLFNKKFNELINLFIDGEIKKKIKATSIIDVDKLFELPRTVNNIKLKDYWIKDYPSVLCNEGIQINDGLLICPFDIRARNIFYELINEAKIFIYISTESFTDEDISAYLINKILQSKIVVKLFTGINSMDFTDRVNKILRNMLACGIEVHTTSENLHGKLIISDKHLVVSSINLNKINLGFSTRANLWRGNTETIMVYSNQDTINHAKTIFEKIFGNDDISSILARKQENVVRDIFSRYHLRVRRDVKETFSRLILSQEINIIQIRNKLGIITSKLMTNDGRTLIEMNDFVRAYILFCYLKEN